MEEQLGVTLYQIGRNGNSASLEDVAQTAGVSVGSVENYTEHYLIAIESLHHLFVWQLTPEEKEKEKEWVDHQLGFKGLW